MIIDAYVRLAQLDAANDLLKTEQKRNAVLSEALEEIRSIIGEWPPWYNVVKTMNKIIREATVED